MSERRSIDNRYCDECCNGDRCDDPTHLSRPTCPHCRGTGFALWTAEGRATWLAYMRRRGLTEEQIKGTARSYGLAPSAGQTLPAETPVQAQLGTGSGAGAQSDSGADSGHFARAVQSEGSTGEALQPCPFCGQSGPCKVGVEDHYLNGEPAFGRRVKCVCGAATSWLIRDGAAEEVWNRRAPTSAAGATKPDELTSSPEPAPEAPRDEVMLNGLTRAETDATASVQGLTASRASGLLPVAREGLTQKALLNACLSYRHDFGLMPESERATLMFEAGEWARAFGLKVEPTTTDATRAVLRAHLSSVAPASGVAHGEAK